jgi:hypothetical protein
MEFDWIQRISGTIVSSVAILLALLSVARVLYTELTSLRRNLRRDRKALQIRLRTRAGHEIRIKVDPSNEESVRSLLEILKKDAAENPQGGRSA